MAHPTLPLIWTLALLAPQDSVQEDLPQAHAELTRAELEHHVRILAADANEGRALFSAGNARAAEYLARALAAGGVEPAGADGGWFQDLRLRRLEYPSAPRLLWKDTEGEVHEARHGVDFDLEVRGRARSTEMLPVRIFYDYTANRLPAKGDPEWAVFFGVAPDLRDFLLEKYKVPSLEDWGLEIAVRQGETGYQAGTPREELRSQTLEGDADGCERVELRGELRSFLELGKLTHVQLLVEEVELDSQERNVVGRLRGVGTPERPEQAQEVVLLSAHYDHIGIRKPRGKRKRAAADADSVCNGADDNASGCAALLELAQALAAGPAPVRTVVFLFTTGEEQGGLGIRHYIEHPVEPLERTVAHLNLEMLGRPDQAAGGAGHLWLTGDERTDLLAAWSERGLAIVPDPHREKRFFTRSDNYPMALRGVVAQSLSSYNLHGDYHRPSDEADKLDYEHLLAATRVVLSAVQPLADGTLQPRWLDGLQPRTLEERLVKGIPREGRGFAPVPQGSSEPDDDSDEPDDDHDDHGGHGGHEDDR